jgi:hemolysin III
VKPLLRGVSHELAALAAVPMTAWLLLQSAGPVARTGAAIYGACLLILFTSSAVYHRPTWSPAIRSALGRLDHASIFLLIAGTYTPLCLRLDTGAGRGLLIFVWVVAALGMVVAVAWDGAPKPLRAAIYVALGWVFVPSITALLTALGGVALALLLAGALLYTIGALVFAVRRPDPLPSVFGFHEVFHLLVVAAAGCHYGVVLRAVQAPG